MKPSAEQVKQFVDDGFLIVDNLFTRQELQPARTRSPKSSMSTPRSSIAPAR